MFDDFFTRDALPAAHHSSQALADNGAVDVSAIALEAGFTLPVVLTRAVFERCVRSPQAETRQRGEQDAAERLRDILDLAARTARQPPRHDQTCLDIEVCQRPRAHRRPARPSDPVTLTMHVGLRDDSAPVFTIALLDED